ncbi:metallophosphoesterase [Sphingomonas sp. QA11]|uniref:metallophosphoesterase n=1 Tax=Sphingomonas sp. QA11 TaxID=2950605 RepID=UPI00234A69F7|nr:metallophosphoesterase [Sphingomonas sp. QA11]WCM26373.1 metallophosphoesterase [Sphingomonas sp. QA11]
MRFLLSLLAALIVALGGVLLLAFLSARADPIVRRADVTLPGWPAGAAPVRVVLVSDVHIGSAAMTQDRLARIVGQINALSPDLVVLAGDFVFGHDPAPAAAMAEALVAPLSGLTARLGVVATLGNHDHWTQPSLIRRALERAHVTVLENQAVVRGPLAIGGVGDLFSHHANLRATMVAVEALPGARMMVTHSPDLASSLPPDLTLLLAGHTHCGQVVLPFLGPVSEVAQPRYRCGMVREGSRTTVVTGGLGASGAPFRLGAPPDLWLLTLGPAGQMSSRSRS